MTVKEILKFATLPAAAIFILLAALVFISSGRAPYWVPFAGASFVYVLFAVVGLLARWAFDDEA